MAEGEPTAKHTATAGALGLEWAQINNEPATFSFRGRTLLTGFPATALAVVVFAGPPIAFSAWATHAYPLVVAGTFFGGAAGASFSTGRRIKKGADGTVLSTRDIRMPLVARVGFPVAMAVLAFKAPTVGMLGAATVTGLYAYGTGNTYQHVTRQGKSTEWSVARSPLSKKAE